MVYGDHSNSFPASLQGTSRPSPCPLWPPAASTWERTPRRVFPLAVGGAVGTGARWELGILSTCAVRGNPWRGFEFLVLGVFRLSSSCRSSWFGARWELGSLTHPGRPPNRRSKNHLTSSTSSSSSSSSSRSRSSRSRRRSSSSVRSS